MALDQKTADAIRALQSKLQLQPVLFVGSGFTRRYFNGPSWEQLLAGLAQQVEYPQPIEYLKTRYSTLPAVGSALIEPAFEWAWDKGAKLFPEGFLAAAPDQSAALKHLACEVVRKSIKKTSDPSLLDELAKFSAIFPQAVITTNYDECLEQLLDGYHRIVGRDVYRYRIESMGEIYKIHGTISDPCSIVLTEADYEKYGERRRYISAKMIAMFAENPVIILGYSLADENVSRILCDVGEVIADDNDFIENIIFIQRVRPDAEAISFPETLPISSDGRTYHIRRIVLEDYLDLFDVLAEPASLSNIRPHLLKAFMSRMNDVVRVDIPSRTVEVTYDHIERISSNRNEIPKLLGFSISDNANTDHPLTLGQIAEALDYRSASGAPSPGLVTNRIIKALKDDYGFDIQKNDNKYHTKIKTGKAKTSFTRKYSKLFFDVAKAMKNGIAIEVDAEKREIRIVG